MTIEEDMLNNPIINDCGSTGKCMYCGELPKYNEYYCSKFCEQIDLQEQTDSCENG